MKKILILGAGEIQLPVIKKAREMGLYTIVVDYNPSAPGFDYADEKYVESTNDFEQVLTIARKCQIDGILTTSDFPVNVVAKISHDLGLCSMSEYVASLCTNKNMQRQLFKDSNVKVPFFKLCHSIDDTSYLNDYPYIVKPVDSSASRGVRKVSSREELVVAFSEALKYSTSKNVLVEEFIEGREFSVETYTQHDKTSIIAITEKLVIGEDVGYFVEDTHIEPARISLNEKKLIESEVRTAIKVIGLNNCPTHTEIKLNDKGAYIIEIACRLGGDYITSDLVPLSTGVDMLANLFRISLGEEIDATPTINKSSCIQFLNTENYNRCRLFIESGDQHIVRYEIKEYQHKAIKDSLDRLGYILLQGDTQEEIESILQLIK